MVSVYTDYTDCIALYFGHCLGFFTEVSNYFVPRAGSRLQGSLQADGGGGGSCSGSGCLCWSWSQELPSLPCALC